MFIIIADGFGLAGKMGDISGKHETLDGARKSAAKHIEFNREHGHPGWTTIYEIRDDKIVLREKRWPTPDKERVVYEWNIEEFTDDPETLSE